MCVNNDNIRKHFLKMLEKKVRFEMFMSLLIHSGENSLRLRLSRWICLISSSLYVYFTPSLFINHPRLLYQPFVKVRWVLFVSVFINWLFLFTGFSFKYEGREDSFLNVLKLNTCCYNMHVFSYLLWYLKIELHFIHTLLESYVLRNI